MPRVIDLTQQSAQTGAVMSHATFDRVLAVLVVAMAGTGLMSLKAGGPDAAWVFALHGLLGGALLVATLLKVRVSVPKALRLGHWRPLALSLLVGLAVVGALAGGFLWVASGRLIMLGPWTVLTLHAWFGLALVPLVVAHLVPRRWRVLRPTSRAGISRRSVLAIAGFGVAGIASFGFASVLERMLGGERRFTGSRWLPSGGIPPPTTFYGEGPPPIDLVGWRLTVGGDDGPDRSLALHELRALGEVEVAAVLDCTSGWALETAWRGVPLRAVLGTAADARGGSVRVTSITGWSTILTMEEAKTALLATGVAGGGLPDANGAPCRLVVPGRRGLDWVKWVADVRIAGTPP